MIVDLTMYPLLPIILVQRKITLIVQEFMFTINCALLPAESTNQAVVNKTPTYQEAGDMGNLRQG